MREMNLRKGPRRTAALSVWWPRLFVACLFVLWCGVGQAQETIVRAIYFVENGDIYRVDPDGRNKTLVVLGAGDVRKIEIDSRNQVIYWSVLGVHRASLVGAFQEVVVVPPHGVYFGFDPNEGHLYYFEEVEFGSFGTLIRHDIVTAEEKVVVQGGLRGDVP